MKYLMLIAVDRSSRPANRAAGEKLMGEYQTFNQRITGSGELVAGDRPSPCPISDAVESSWVADAATASLRQRRPVSVAEVRQP